MTPSPQEKKDETANEVPFADMCDSALEHYEDISNRAHHWNSLIPMAIQFYKEHGNPAPLTSQEDWEKRWMYVWDASKDIIADCGAGSYGKMGMVEAEMKSFVEIERKSAISSALQSLKGKVEAKLASLEDTGGMTGHYIAGQKKILGDILTLISTESNQL